VLYDKKALKPIGNTAIDTKNEAIAYTLTKVPTKNYSLLKMKKQIAAIFILVLFTSTFSIAQVPKLIGEYLVGIRNNDNIHISPDGTKLLTKSTYGVTLRNLLNDSVVTYFDVSKKEAKQYIDMLPKDELKNIISQINGK
jgi:hypothetical protein